MFGRKGEHILSAGKGTAILAGFTAVCACASSSPSTAVANASPPQRLAAAEDPLNVAMTRALTSGVLVTLRVSPQRIELKHVALMLVPANGPQEVGPGDYIIVTAYGRGTRVARSVVSDPTILVQERASALRARSRIVSVTVPAPSWIDTLEVTTTASGQSARFDISSVIKNFCAFAKGEPVCGISPQ
jgi:hypothetical protein